MFFAFFFVILYFFILLQVEAWQPPAVSNDRNPDLGYLNIY